MTTEVRYNIKRYAEGIKCKCGGYADKAEPTHEEKLEYDCGRYRLGLYNCCAVAFVCNVCKTRIVGNQAAPEME